MMHGREEDFRQLAFFVFFSIFGILFAIVGWMAVAAVLLPAANESQSIFPLNCTHIRCSESARNEETQCFFNFI